MLTRLPMAGYVKAIDEGVAMKSGSATGVLAARPIAAASASVAAGVGVLTASAWLSVPFYPVPLTMQTLAVLLIGGLLGSRLGVASVAGYLALGSPAHRCSTVVPAVLLCSWPHRRLPDGFPAGRLFHGLGGIPRSNRSQRSAGTGG